MNGLLRDHPDLQQMFVETVNGSARLQAIAEQLAGRRADRAPATDPPATPTPAGPGPDVASGVGDDPAGGNVLRR